MERFEATFAGQSLMRVYFDHAITFVTSGSGEFRFGNTLAVTLPGSQTIGVEPEAPGAGAELVLALLHQPLDRVVVEDSGLLGLTFTNGATVRVGPDGDYEAWTYAGDQDGVKVICLPGGGLTTFGV